MSKTMRQKRSLREQEPSPARRNGSPRHNFRIKTRKGVNRSSSSRNGLKLSTTQHVYSTMLHVVMFLMVMYCLLPLIWLFMSSTKTLDGLHNSNGLWFAGGEHGGNVFWSNLAGTFTMDNGIYGRWIVNTIGYALAAGLGSTIIATLAGYAIATMAFPGRNLILACTLAFMAVPTTVITIPLFLMYAKMGLVNTPWSVIVPQLSNPFGLYLMIIYARMSIPTALLESAKIDGAGPLRIFWKIGMPLMSPGFVTVLLFALVGAWNNYMLPLVMLSGQEQFPVTVGLNMWMGLVNTTNAAGSQSGSITSFILMGSLVAVVPIIISFCFLQKYWQSGLAAGAVKQ